MSLQLISRRADLKQLQDEGYALEIRGAYLLIKQLPYVTALRQVLRGTLVTELTLAGEAVTQPGSHVAYFSGEHPCRPDGTEIEGIRHSANRQSLLDGLVVDRSFSAKPISGSYVDYYHKVTTYANLISGPAAVLDPAATAQVFPPIAVAAELSVFKYWDTSSSRADIVALSERLGTQTIGIVGLSTGLSTSPSSRAEAKGSKASQDLARLSRALDRLARWRLNRDEGRRG